jgi:hypothetical protein
LGRKKADFAPKLRSNFPIAQNLGDGTEAKRSLGFGRNWAAPRHKFDGQSDLSPDPSIAGRILQSGRREELE